MNTPSKKIIIPISLIAIAVIGSVIAIKFAPKVTYTAASVSTSTESSAITIDSDNDGLKDWEEGLWKSDPKNSDTDGDGTPDGEEIKLGRDPVIAGPNDKLDTGTVGSKINPETDADLTSTDKFSRELFMKIVASGQSEKPPTEEDYQNFLNATIKSQVDTQKAKIYTLSDLFIDTNETPEKIKAYGNAVVTILRTPPPQKLEYEIDIVTRATTKKDPTELKKLENNIASYKTIVSSLLKLTVPKSAEKIHLAFVNANSSMAQSITGLSYILTDPIKAMPSVATYGESYQSFLFAIHAFNGYFKSNNTKFEPDDAGYQAFDAL